MLNVVNGILFIQIREKDLDLIQEELAKQSIDDRQPTTPAIASIRCRCRRTSRRIDE